MNNTLDLTVARQIIEYIRKNGYIIGKYSNKSQLSPYKVKVTKTGKFVIDNKKYDSGTLAINTSSTSSLLKLYSVISNDGTIFEFILSENIILSNNEFDNFAERITTN